MQACALLVPLNPLLQSFELPLHNLVDRLLQQDNGDSIVHWGKEEETAGVRGM